ncbi:MAG: response regulator transcription factor [Chitinophagaceae bacterium]|jgi:two-component system LytT family response regulator|nr:response regulator transcription factor [Bacteroidota bacterium]MBP9933101.1 response regulator transcription factor [Chitinophagaceae bacterium]
MFKTVIIDDELNCVEVLEILIKQNFDDIEIVEKFTSSKQALQYLEQNQVDLVFLDIQMPFMTGIELLHRLGRYNFNVIFTTAYDQYAISAIKLSALDYLLKPIDEELLTHAIQKFRKLKGETNIQQQLTNLLMQYNLPTNPVQIQSGMPGNKIAVGFQDKILFYDPQEILYCQSSDNYTTIVLTNGEKIIASKTMRYFEDILTPQGFIRPHQSYIINSKYIQQYSKKDGGFLVMTDGSSIPVSRNRKEEILMMFKGEI